MSPEPSRSAPFSRDQPRSSAHLVQVQQRRAAAPRSKLSATITSVPPWIGTASGLLGLQRAAPRRACGASGLPRRRRVRFCAAMDARPLARRLAVARGDEPADLVVRGGRVLSVFTREWLDDRRRDRRRLRRRARRLRGRGDARRDAAATSCPGFIDAHMHLESSKLLVDEFARLVLPLGTTAVVADPHEIANVLGTDGVHWLLDVCGGLPLDVYFMASSCVPASRVRVAAARAHAGRPRGAAAPPARDRARRDDELPRRRSPATPRELAKLGARREHVDGHAPGVLGKRAERLRRGRDPLRPRGVHARGGARAAARRACGC